jgi:electron transfer flavoprotein alpha subunit
VKFLVFIEQREGKIRKASLEALSLARKLSGAGAGGSVAAVIAGKGVAPLARDLGKYGAGVVYVGDREDLALYSTKGYVGALDAAAAKENPDAVLIAATAMGKDIAPRFAARRDSGVLADVMDLRLEGDKLVGSRPVYSGKARAEVDCGASKLQIATTRPNVFPAEASQAGEPRVENLELSAVEPRAKVVRVETSATKELDVSEADVIVSGGRGIKGPENWPMIRDLQEALGAALGASRAVVDAGWIDHQHQVGQTGKVVSPTLYVACGISGAIQHLAGMGTSKVIVALNKDPEAPIFKVATYGIVGDIFQIVPEVAKAVRAAKAE